MKIIENISAIAIVFITGLIISCSLNPAEETTEPIVVNFPDPNFEALIRETLDIPERSDRKYHQQMSTVLREVQDGRLAEGGGGEAASWNDESPLSARSEDGGAGGMSELLRLSPTQDMY